MKGHFKNLGSAFLKPSRKQFSDLNRLDYLQVSQIDSSHQNTCK